MGSARRLIFALSFSVFALSVGASSSSASVTPVGTATFNGGTINLSLGWQDATVCVVSGMEQVSCYSSLAGASLAIGLNPDTTCGGGLELFQNANYGGNELIIDSTGSWINLDTLGFGDETSSWKNPTTCNANAAKSTDGSGTHLAMGANSSSSYVGSSWNDSINSAYLDS